jgi:hypothetical protein
MTMDNLRWSADTLTAMGRRGFQYTMTWMQICVSDEVYARIQDKGIF